MILAVEYAVVHKIQEESLARSEVGIAQWRALANSCKSAEGKADPATVLSGRGLAGGRAGSRPPPRAGPRR
jgi:hypothetical protein